jgi:EmrB/QacA subfamily drug resistance transporter
VGPSENAHEREAPIVIRMAADVDAESPSATLSPIAVLTLIGGAFLPILSFFIINVALPTIGTDLDASKAELQLVVGTYGIANAMLVVVGGRLGDAFGRRRLFLIGMAGFTLFSLLCGLAPNIEALLVLRIGQGALAALMTPQVLATIAATLTGVSRVRAVGMFGAAGGIGAAVGQILGGVLVSADIAGLGWRLVFFVNVPICLLVFIAAIVIVPETKAVDRLAVDGVGAVLLGVTLVFLLLPLTEGRALGWPLWTLLMLGAVVPMALLFGGHQRRTERVGKPALVPPSVLRLRGMQIGLTIAVAFFASFGGFMFAFALATQGEAGMSPLEGGLTYLPLAASFLIVSIYSAALQERWGPSIIARGWALQAVGYTSCGIVLWSLWPNIGPLTLAVPMFVIGFGSGLVMMPLFGVVMAQVPAEQAGLGSGILITTQQTCISLGAATVGTFYLAVSTSSLGQGGALAVVEFAIAAISIVAVPFSLRLRRS